MRNRIANDIKKALSFLLVFSFVLSSFCFTNFNPVSVSADNTTVAVIGSNEYSSLKAAFDAANDGATIKLVSDAEINEQITVNKKVTLTGDSSNRSVIRTSGASGSYAFNITSSGDLTITGGASSKLIFNGTTASTAFFVINGGSLTMNSGAVIRNNINTSSNGGAVYIGEGNFTMDGGEISENGSSKGSGVYVSGNAGTFSISGDVKFSPSNDIYLSDGKYINISGTLTGEGSIPVTLDRVDTGTKVAQKANASVKLPDNQLSRFIVNSVFGVTLNGTNIVTANTPKNYVAKIGSKQFYSLEEAIASVSEGENATVTMIGDTFISSKISINNKNITIVSEGTHTVTRASSFKTGYLFEISPNGSLTLGGGNGTLNISGGNIQSTLSAINVGGKLTLNAGANIISHLNNNPNSFYQGVVNVVSGGTFTMNGGTLSGNTVEMGTVYIYGGTFRMSGGEIYSNTANYGGAVYIDSGVFDMSGGSIYNNSAKQGGSVWNGGTFKLSGNASVYSSSSYTGDIYLPGGKTITVTTGWSGGNTKSGFSKVLSVNPANTALKTKIANFVNFSGNPSNANASYFALYGTLAATNKLYAKDDYVYIGPFKGADYVAYIGDNGYESLKEAVDAVPANGNGTTINVVADIELNETINIEPGKNIILTDAKNPEKYDDYSIRLVKRASSFDGAMLNVKEGASLSIKGSDGKGLVIDGNAVSASFAAVLVYGNLTLENGATIKGNVNKKNESLSANNAMLSTGGAIYCEGIFTMTGGLIESNYASYGGAVYLINGTFNMTGGDIKNNNALSGGGVMIRTTIAEDRGYFNMTGGTISQNNANENSDLSNTGLGGGVYIDNGSVFAMSGGVLDGNTAKAGGGVCVGSIRSSDNTSVPTFYLSNSALINTNNNVYLTLTNDSVINVTGALSGYTKDNPIVISLPSTLSQNSILVRYTIEGNTDKQNGEAAKADNTKGIYKLDDSLSAYYVIAQSINEKNTLINSTSEEQNLQYKAGRHYNGFDKDKDKEKDKENDKDKNNTAITISPDSCLTAYFQMTYFENIYKNMYVMLTAPFAKGTKITMIDYSKDGKIGYYYYEVTGKETKVATAKETGNLNTVEIPLKDFIMMGTKNKNYGELSEGDVVSSDKMAKKTEKLLFVIDFSATETKVPDGEYSLNWNHYYPGEKEGERYDISKNFGSVKYTVLSKSKSEVKLSKAEGSITVDYSLAPGSLSLDSPNAVVVFEVANGTLPKGTVFTYNNKQYLVNEGSDELAIALPVDKDGKTVPKDKMEISISNYYGTAILGCSIRALIYPSSDGMHYTVGSAYDAESNGVTIALNATNTYSILVTNSDNSNKPIYTYEDLIKKSLVEMKVSALVNTEVVGTVMVTLQKKTGEEYVDTDISELFEGYSNATTSMEIKTGKIAFKIKDITKGFEAEEYRLKFTNVKVSEYVKFTVKDVKK